MKQIILLVLFATLSLANVAHQYCLDNCYSEDKMCNQYYPDLKSQCMFWRQACVTTCGECFEMNCQLGLITAYNSCVALGTMDSKICWNYRVEGTQ